MSPAPSKPSADHDDERLKQIHYVCKKCGWTFSSRNEYCPMCGVPMKLSDKELVDAFQQFIDLNGSYITRDDAFGFIKAYRKSHRMDPALNDLWNAAKQLAKLDEMSEDQLKKLEKEKKEKGEIKAKMDKMREQKEKELLEQRKLELKQSKLAEEEEKRRQAEESAERAKMKGVKSKCRACGAENPADSRFCLECGSKMN
jgi:uncharacterized OB-fold protein